MCFQIAFNVCFIWIYLMFYLFGNQLPKLYHELEESFSTVFP